MANFNDATITRLFVSQVGSTVADDAPNAPNMGNFAANIEMTAGAALQSEAYTVTWGCTDITLGVAAPGLIPATLGGPGNFDVAPWTKDPSGLFWVYPAAGHSVNRPGPACEAPLPVLGHPGDHQRPVASYSVSDPVPGALIRNAGGGARPGRGPAGLQPVGLPPTVGRRQNRRSPTRVTAWRASLYRTRVALARVGWMFSTRLTSLIVFHTSAPNASTSARLTSASWRTGTAGR